MALWDEVHITSVLPPEEVYKRMVDSGERDQDKIDQLLRRIDEIVYHYIENGEYKQFSLHMSEYTDYSSLRDKVNKGFLEAPDYVQQLFE